MFEQTHPLLIYLARSFTRSLAQVAQSAEDSIATNMIMNEKDAMAPKTEEKTELIGATGADGALGVKVRGAAQHVGYYRAAASCDTSEKKCTPPSTQLARCS
jgi:hypothetical protein